MADIERPVVDEDILRYVDGEIDPNRREAVEAHLQTSGADAASVTAFRHQNRLLREAFDSILEERIPESLVATVVARSRPRYARPLWAACAALVLFIAGSASGWYLANRGAGDTVVDASRDFRAFALAAHRVYTPEVRHAVEVAASDEQHLVTWLSKRLGHKLKAPALGPLGFELVGGRLLATPDGRPAAQFMYQDTSLRRLTLYVRSASQSEATSFRFADEQDCGIFYWIDAPFAYALVGKLERAELQTVSTSVYEQFVQLYR